MGILKEFCYPPTAIQASGQGLHAYWLFKEAQRQILRLTKPRCAPGSVRLATAGSLRAKATAVPRGRQLTLAEREIHREILDLFTPGSLDLRGFCFGTKGAVDIVATGSYYMLMTKAVGVKELKNRLSEYLRDVKSGVRIVVTERQQVIAELKQPDFPLPAGRFSSLYLQWCAEGKVRPPGAKTKVIRESHLKSRGGLAQELLNEDRG